MWSAYLVMSCLSSFCLVLALPPSGGPARNGSPIPRRRPLYARNASATTPASDRADAVREAFRHAWAGYKEYAFPHDELHPVSNGFSDSR
jgi:Glycosyl hydrolase family 47